MIGSTQFWCRCGVAAALIEFMVTAASAQFTPIQRVPVTLERSAKAYPGGKFDAENLIDGDLETEYSSDNLGTNTFIEVSFAKSTRIVAFRHVQRNDPGLVGVSEIEFESADGSEAERCRVRHVVKRNAETFFVLPHPVDARRAKWRIAELGSPGVGTVGGAEIQFFTDGTLVAMPVPFRDQLEIAALPFLERTGKQKGILRLFHAYLEPAEVQLQIGDAPALPLRFAPGLNTFDIEFSAVKTETDVTTELKFQKKPLYSTNIVQRPVQELTLYLVPHSHTDIGYTGLQTAIEDKQVNNLAEGIRLAQRTADYPEGARFVWNVESLWAADSFLKRRGAAGVTNLRDAVKAGQVELTGMYLNLLSGLCRPEELLQGFRQSSQLARRFGVPIETAMISDVPGFTWGGVTAMSQAGIRYFSAGPNYGETFLMNTWQDRPFYWIGSDGVSKVLVWVPLDGYALAHRYDALSPKLLGRVVSHLQMMKYPYDMAYIRWAGHGDNAVPDPQICEFIKEWNKIYRSPRLVISGASAPFKALEQKYEDVLPVVRGDWTPYWEDGAASSAFEVALNRGSSDRLAQAQTAFALLHPTQYPAAEFEAAWRDVLLFSEHTWGAAESIREPDSPGTKEQWKIKKSYADQAGRESNRLLNEALAADAGTDTNARNAKWIEVINTSSWPRSGLVEVPDELSDAGTFVENSEGQPIRSQRLKSGQLVFLAEKVPGLAGRRYRISNGSVVRNGLAVSVGTNWLKSDTVSVRLDESTGDIVELTGPGNHNYADCGEGQKLNQYLYIRGSAPNRIEQSGPAKISIEDAGPLVASLVVQSSAPGCRSLRRTVRLIAGQDYVEIRDEVDKTPLWAVDYRVKAGKESVSIAFPFNVPAGNYRLDIPFATMDPGGADQLAASCTNWFTVSRWLDLANGELGITWVTLDAPMVQFDAPARQLESRRAPHPALGSTHRFYSWLMNNRWGTNYKAKQEGPVTFRYVLRPHPGPCDAAEATRFATGFSQPLLVRKCGATAPVAQPLLSLSADNVLVTALKPCDDRKGWIIRLFEAAGQRTSTRLQWGGRRPKAVYLSGTDEARGRPVSEDIQFQPHGLVTLRAEFTTNSASP